MKETAKAVVYLTTGLVVGGAAGYFVTRNALKAKYELDMEEQIQDVKDHYKLLRKEGEHATLVPEVEPVQYDDILEGLEYIAETISDEEVEEADEVEDVISHRNSNEPYIISIKEFMEDRDEYDKSTITYFEDDDVLCDEREEVIPNVDETVGNQALTKFGHLSTDKNIVYVRNERISTDFEIIRDTRSFSEVVLGFKEDKGVRRMREDD